MKKHNPRRNRPAKSCVTGPVEALEPRLLMTVFTVTHNADSGAGSLRWALDQSNQTAGVDTIAFNIAGADRVIRLKSELPALYDAGILDATTQPGYAGRPMVQIDGALVPRSSDGRDPTGMKMFGDSTIKGLSFTRFIGTAIDTLPRTDKNYGGNIIQRNWLGVDLDGKAAGNRAFGVGIWSPGNLIGGSTRAEGNVISASLEGNGIYNWGPMNGNNRIQNNLIGVDPTGTKAMGNFKNGVFLSDSPGNKIADNVISNNGDDGIFLFLDDCKSTVVQGNIVGLDITGTVAMPNKLYGMEIQCPDTLIGGDLASQRNIVSGNLQAGIVLYGGQCTGTQIRGNFIGTDITGTRDRGNAYQGIAISGGQYTTIHGNVISGNNTEGVGIFPGWHQTLTANTIGADVNGSPLPNGTWGISVINGTIDTTIGGGKGMGNLIAYNVKSGVYITEGQTTVVNNVVVNNGGDGVQIAGHDQNRVEGNSIYANGALGINIAWDSVSPNDVGDGDEGVNHVQNFPVISSAVSDLVKTVVTGTLNSRPNQTYKVCLYQSPAADPTGYGEGKTYLGYVTVTTDGSGNAAFSASFDATTPNGYVASATATDADGNTSEFSLAKTVVGQVSSGDTTPPQVTAASFEDSRRPNHLRFVFSEDVSGSLALGDLVVTNLTTGKAVAPRSIEYNRNTNVAVFYYKAVVPDGYYRATLNAPGVTDAAGNPLSASYVLNFHHMTGDANGDCAVDKSDRSILRANWGRTNARFSQGDFNYDKVVNQLDADLMTSKWYTKLPTPAVTPAAVVATSVKADKSIFA